MLFSSFVILIFYQGIYSLRIYLLFHYIKKYFSFLTFFFSRKVVSLPSERDGYGLVRCDFKDG